MKRFFKKSQFRAIETTLMAISFFWAGILALPMNTFVISKAYAAMADLAPEYAWSLLMCMVGLLHLAGMIVDSRKTRNIGLMLAAGQWYFIGTMMLLGTPANTAWGTYYTLACLSTWLYAKEVGGRK